MTTLERPHETARVPTPPERSRSPVALAIVAVVALVLGGIAGWMLRGDDEDAAIVLAGEGELTARQEQMLDVARDAERAWRDGDVDAVLASFTPDGTFEALDTVYRVDDGSLAAYIEQGNWSSLDVLELALVRDTALFTFHRYGSGDHSETMTFTATGEPLIVSHVIHD